MTPEDPPTPRNTDMAEGLGEGSGTVPGTGLEPAPSRPPGRRWLFYLFCRPRLFFTHFVVKPVPLLTVLACYIFGVGNVIDGIAERMLQADLSGRPNPFAWTADSWPTYWGACLFLGVISAGSVHLPEGWHQGRKADGRPRT